MHGEAAENPMAYAGGEPRNLMDAEAPVKTR
jgi:hypothetical protein